MPEFNDSTIIHVAHQVDIAESCETGLYVCDSLSAEGFIHCCLETQLAGVLERYYKGVTGIVLLSIDPARLSSELRYENTVGGTEEFPHIYGPLNLDAVISETELK